MTKEEKQVEYCLMTIRGNKVNNEQSKPTLTQEERGIANMLTMIDEYKYFARDKSGELYAYVTKPKKFEVNWGASRPFFVSSYMYDFIKWEDEEPWAIEDLLKLGVKE